MKSSDKSNLISRGTYYTQEQLDAFDEMADATGQPKTYHVSKALDAYIEANLYDIRALQQAIKEANDPNTVYLSHEEFKAWVKCVGTENEYELPC